ncbi:MAG TPA: hypothetical protein VII91_01150, partial [Bauldia sp.]
MAEPLLERGLEDDPRDHIGSEVCAKKQAGGGQPADWNVPSAPLTRKPAPRVQGTNAAARRFLYGAKRWSSEMIARLAGIATVLALCVMPVTAKATV